MSRYRLPDGTPVPRTTEVMTIEDMNDGLCMWAAGLAIDEYVALSDGTESNGIPIKDLRRRARRAFQADRSAKAHNGTCGHAVIEEANRAMVEGRDPKAVTHDEEGRPFSQREMEHGLTVGRNYAMWCQHIGGAPVPVLVETRDGGQMPLIETQMVSETKLVGGTPDLVAHLPPQIIAELGLPDGAIAGLDWKSGKRIGNVKQLLQSGSYDGLLKENFGIDVDVFGIVRLSPYVDGDFESLWIPRDVLTAFRGAFGKVVDAHHAIKNAMTLWEEA